MSGCTSSTSYMKFDASFVSVHDSLPKKCGDGCLDDSPKLDDQHTSFSMYNGGVQPSNPNNSEIEVLEDEGDPSSVEYWDIGDPTYKCQFWYEERLNSHYNSKNPKYSACCMQGKIQLPPLKEPPQVLHDLLHENSEKSKHFRKNIRSYNNMFSFTSMGGKIDSMPSQSSGPPSFTLHGRNYHLMGSLLPAEGSTPKFAQLYIYDTENEIENRIKSVRNQENINTLHAEIVVGLKERLDEHNVLVKSFRMAREKLAEEEQTNVRLRLIGRRGGDARRYNLPSASEVASLVPGDFDECLGDRDILVETRSGQLKRINELNAAYLALQYPLLFPYGEDGYREDILFSEERSSTGGGRKNVSIREWFAYRLHEREHKPSSILMSERLTQQFIVDAYTMVESARLTYVRTH